MRRFATLAATMLIAAGCSGTTGTSAAPTALLDLPDATPGDIVGLIATSDGGTGRFVEWIDRLDGTIRRLDIDDPSATPEPVAAVTVGTDGEQRGLLGQVVLDGRRFASWTQPGSFDLVVGEIVDGGPGRLVWSAGPASGGAIGGVLDTIDGDLVVGIGRNTAFDRDTKTGGAILRLDPDGEIDQQPDVVSVGYTNPWAFTVTASGEIWVADNAAGPDPDDESVDDLERIGRADLVDDRNRMTRLTGPGRAPSSMVELPDGRIGICGFLDNELRAFDVVDDEDGRERSALERAGTIMPCLTGAAVFEDGTVVTVALGDPGLTLQIRRP